jgi:Zn-dependent protease
MAIISLVNLLPINPLDGGRMLRAITFSINSTLGFIIHALGILAMGYLAYRYGGGMVYFLLVVSVLTFILELSEYKSKRKWEGEADELTEDVVSVPGHVIPMSKLAIFISSLVYFGVIVLLLSLLVLTVFVPGTEMAMDTLRNG